MSTQITISRPIKLEVNTTPITGGVSGLALYNNAGILGELNLASIYVPLTRTLTINGTTQDLSADRTFTISTGITIGTTAITSGTVGRVLFEGTGNVVQESANLFWDNTNGRLGIGTGTPLASVHSAGSVNGAFGSLFQNTSTGTSASLGINVANNTATIGGVSTYSSTNNTAYLRSNVVLASYPTASNVIIATNLDVASGGTGQIQFKLNGYAGSINSAIFATGNWGINTTTDAGFKLDVNGTARVSGNGTLGITSTKILTIRPEDTTGAYGNSCSIRGGASNGRLDFYSATNITELRDNIILLTSATGPSIQVGTASINLNVGGTRLQVAPTTGNILIGTTTDAGYKLDVNGTARVSNDLTIGGNRYLKAFRWTNDDVSKPLQIEGNSNYNVDGLNIISLNNSLLNNTKNLVNIGLASTVNTQSSSSTDAFNSVLIQTAYNFTFGTHSVKGIYYNPTLTSMVNTTHHAFHSTSGRIRFENLPTSPTGLSSGDVWNNLGILTIV